MKTLLVLLFLMAATGIHAQQQYIGMTPKTVKKNLRNYMKFYKYTMFTMEEKKDEICFLLREDRVQHADFRFGFDPKGKCIASGTYAYCFECIEKTLQTVLKKKTYGWVKLNDSTWFSSYHRSLQMTLKKNEGTGAMSGLDIRKMIWSRTWYDNRIAGKI